MPSVRPAASRGARHCVSAFGCERFLIVRTVALPIGESLQGIKTALQTDQLAGVSIQQSPELLQILSRGLQVSILQGDFRLVFELPRRRRFRDRAIHHMIEDPIRVSSPRDSRWGYAIGPEQPDLVP